MKIELSIHAAGSRAETLRTLRSALDHAVSEQPHADALASAIVKAVQPEVTGKGQYDLTVAVSITCAQIPEAPIPEQPAPAAGGGT